MKNDDIIKKAKERKLFEETLDKMDSRELQIEIIRELRESNKSLEKTRRNTSIMVWWLIVIPILLTVIYMFFLVVFWDNIF